MRCYEAIRHDSRGFPIIELVFVVTIVSLLAALLLPAVQTAREAARRVQCVNNLKQIALAGHGYGGVRGSLPLGMPLNREVNTGAINSSHSLFVALLPQLEQSPLYNAVNFD